MHFTARAMFVRVSVSLLSMEGRHGSSSRRTAAAKTGHPCAPSFTVASRHTEA